MSGHNYEICEKIITILSTNELIRDYCQEKFGKQAKLFLGIDANKPPVTNDAPFIMVIPDGTSLPEDRSAENNIFVGCVITETTMSTGGQITKFEGFKTIEDFERLVFDCIDNLIQEFISEYSIMDTGEARYLAHYPEFHSQRNLKIISERN